MSDWWVRLRAAVGMGVTWALGWAPLGAILGSALWLLHGPPAGLMSVVEINAVTFGILGFVGGTLFSTVLRLAEGHRRFDELTLPRFAALGAIGGLLLGGLAVAASLWGASGVPVLGVTVAAGATLLGSGSAVGSLMLARRAEDRALLDVGQANDVVDPSDEDAHRLLDSGR